MEKELYIDNKAIINMDLSEIDKSLPELLEEAENAKEAGLVYPKDQVINFILHND